MRVVRTIQFGLTKGKKNVLASYCESSFKLEMSFCGVSDTICNFHITELLFSGCVQRYSRVIRKLCIDFVHFSLPIFEDLKL